MIDPKEHFQFERGPSCDGRSLARLRIAPGLPWFSGHFPGAPVLPAVAIVDATLELMRLECRDPGLRIRTIRSAKFLRPILPGALIEIDLALEAPGRWKARWREITHPEAPGSVVELALDA